MEMRLIDADALREATQHSAWINWKDVENEPTVGGWISVKDRMPDDGGAVLAYAPRYKNICTLVLIHGKWNHYGTGLIQEYNSYWLGEIAYWMPLPEPPEEVTGDD